MSLGTNDVHVGSRGVRARDARINARLRSMGIKRVYRTTIAPTLTPSVSYAPLPGSGRIGPTTTAYATSWTALRVLWTSTRLDAQTCDLRYIASDKLTSGGACPWRRRGRSLPQASPRG